MSGRPTRTVILLALAAAGCKGTEPPGTINIVLDPTPRVTRDASLLLTGSVARTPASSKQIMVITASGGAAAATDSVNTDRFDIRVTLTANANNPLSLTATDGSGSTSNTVSHAVRHDNQAPTVASMTPADTSDNASPLTSVQLAFNEAVVVSQSGGVRLARQGASITGTTALSADSTTLTFTPASGLSPNGVYRVTLTGVADAAGNALPSNFSACFATSTAGAAPVQSFPDSSTPDRFSSATATPAPLPPDLVSARLVRDGTVLAGIIRFTGPRTFSYSTANHAIALIDFDTDRDTTTGFLTLKDSLMRQQADATFRTYQSKTRVEWVIGLEPAIGDTAGYVGQYVGFDQVQLTAGFVPTVCGAMFGFAVPFSLLGNEDGLANVLITGLSGVTAQWAQFWIDPFPTINSLALDLRAPTVAPPAVSPYVVQPASGRLIRPRRPSPGRPLRR